jgi:uncharacterized protein YeaO (DUF488 family)
MVKRYSVSVSDELGNKIDRWKDDLSPSTIFQQAMATEIAKKENFIQRIKEDKNMEDIIERLRNEKKASEQRYYEAGKEDGLQWAKAAEYEDLLLTATEDPEDLKDSGEYRAQGYAYHRLAAQWRDQMQYYPGLLQSDNEDYLNPLAGEWLDGWFDGVQTFWGEISDKL